MLFLRMIFHVSRPEISQQTRDIDTVLVKCLSAVYDSGPTMATLTKVASTSCVYWNGTSIYLGYCYEHVLLRLTIPPLRLKALNISHVNHGDQRVLFNLNSS